MKKIAIVGVGNDSHAYEIAKAASLIHGDIEIVSATDTDNKQMEDMTKQASEYLSNDSIYKLHALPLLDIPHIPKRGNNKPFYYNVPRKKHKRK